ncbi:MAG: GNAT family N-acetyltransferase [bacterium]
MTIRPLTPELRGAYLAYFDDGAFTDNPEWAGCYCYFPHADHASERWNVRSNDDNRTAAAAMIDSERMHGFLAFVDEQPAGWCNANTRASFTIFDGDGGDPTTIGTIACFVVAESHRGKGIARELLAAAVEGFRAQGLASVEAYPLPEATTTKANHFGPLSMYLAAGFEVVGQEDKNLIVRKLLG